MLDLVALNLGLAVTGCATAVRSFLAAGTGGAIVNVSSHQAQRPVRGALPYATAKAGSRVSPVRWPSTTGRAASGPTPWRSARSPTRATTTCSPTAVVAHLLSPDAGYVNGAIVPVDGGRSVLGLDPEAR